MPSLYKRDTGTPLPVRQVPAKSVPLPNEADDSEFSARLEALVAQEIDRRWREACLRLEAAEAELKRVSMFESQKALEAARTEGYAEGMSEARAVLETEMAVVRKAYLQLESDRLAFVEESKRDIVALALRIAEAALRSELNTNTNALLALFQSAYDELVAQRKVFLFVHPDRLTQIEAFKHLLPLAVDGPVVIRTDSTMDKDSFRIEDELGGVRYDLPTELRRLEGEVRRDGL